MYNSQEIAKRIKQMAKSKKISLKTLLSECELGINTISQMSKGNDMLSKNLAKIADYLDCSVDYLLGRSDKQEREFPIKAVDNGNVPNYIMTTNKSETILLIEYRSLNAQGQEYIMQTMDMVKDRYKKSASISQMEIG